MVGNGNILLEQDMQIQNLSEPEFSIISTRATFRCILIRHIEHSIKSLQLTDLLHYLELTRQTLDHIKLKRERKTNK